MKATINTSPLIFLAKLDLLKVLEIYNKVYTTKLVMAEIIAGLEKGKNESLKVIKLVDEYKLIVNTIKVLGSDKFGCTRVSYPLYN